MSDDAGLKGTRILADSLRMHGCAACTDAANEIDALADEIERLQAESLKWQNLYVELAEMIGPFLAAQERET